MSKKKKQSKQRESSAISHVAPLSHLVEANAGGGSWGRSHCTMPDALGAVQGFKVMTYYTGKKSRRLSSACKAKQSRSVHGGSYSQGADR